MRKIFIPLLFVLISVTVLPITAMAFTPNTNDYKEQQYAVLALVNEERSKAGLPSLKMAETEAVQVAMIRAYEISIRFTHTRPSGSGVRSLLFDYGVECIRYGENLAYGYNSAAAVMNGWMRSASHRANIMQKEYTKLAVGVYKSNGTMYWVQIFLTN